MPQSDAILSLLTKDSVIDTGCDGTGAMANKSFRLAAAKGRLTPVGTSMFGVTGVVESRQVRVGAEAVRRTGER